jgi:hypothetical protein
MAYLTCPWCRTPQLIGDDAADYRCFTCHAEVRFFECTYCHFVQTVNKGWAAFTCGKCDRKVELPRRWGYSESAKALRVRGVGHPFPKM